MQCLLQPLFAKCFCHILISALYLYIFLLLLFFTFIGNFLTVAVLYITLFSCFFYSKVPYTNFSNRCVAVVLSPICLRSVPCCGAGAPDGGERRCHGEQKLPEAPEESGHPTTCQRAGTVRLRTLLGAC